MERTLSRRRESLLRALTTRHGRKNSGYCLGEGVRCVGEILNLRPDLIECCILREDAAIPLDLPDDRTVMLDCRKFDSLAATVNSQGILLLAKQPEYRPLNVPLNDPFVLLLDRVADPGNFGTILRTARAVGLHEVWIVKGGVDPFGGKTIRSASGAQFALTLRCAESLEEAVQSLRELGITRFFRTEPSGGHSVFTEADLFKRSAIVLGNEANGAGRIDSSLPLNIPMPGSAESLNVAQAATVILFEFVRRTGEQK